MAALGSRIDRLEQVLRGRGTPHPSDGDAAAVVARVLAGEVAIRDLSDEGLLTLLADDTVMGREGDERPAHDDTWDIAGVVVGE